MKKTLVVNLFGGPGTGKSTGATYIFSKLKMDGFDVEYVSEFAKDKVWERNGKVFQCQMYVTGKQVFKISRCIGEVDVIVTDSPILMGAIYAQDDAPLQAAIIYESKKFNNLDVFLHRVKEYNPNGRFQTETEARALDVQIHQLVSSESVPGAFMEATGDIHGYNEVVAAIEKKLKGEK